jgi:diguanylate cyclase (GGDEF)-like protein/PAS domain S-box-containing protein
MLQPERRGLARDNNERIDLRAARAVTRSVVQMSLIELLCLLLVIVATLLLVLYLMQRRELQGVGEMARQLDQLLQPDGTPAGPIDLLTDGPELQQLSRGLNRLIVRARELAESEGRGPGLFAELADRTHEIVLIHREAILFANQQFASLVGIGREELIGRSLADLVAPEFTDLVNDVLQKGLAGTPTAERFEVEIVGLQAQVSRLELNLRLIEHAGARELLVTGVEIVQTTQVKALVVPTYAQELAESGVFRRPVFGPDGAATGQGAADPQQRLALDSIVEAIVTTDPAGLITYMNPAAERLVGASATSVAGKALGDVVALVDEADRRALADPVYQALATGLPVTLSRRAIMISRGAGDERAIEFSASPMRTSDGELVGAAMLLHDVTELRGFARQLSYQATHDALTGMINRREFERRLDEAIASAQRGDSTHILCYLDLDRFKAVNDTSGHLAGDALLREIAGQLRAAVRDSDSVGRIGGDEFGMLLIGCPLEKARQIADDLCRTIGEFRFTWKDQIFQVGVSIGLLEIARESGSVDDSLAAADSACYMAKRQGSGVVVYSARDAALARSTGEIQWLQKLQSALRDERFELYVQPIVPAVASATLDGPAMEVFVRMKDEAGADVLPGEFIRAAERYRLMGLIDRWVVRRTLTAVVDGVLEVPAGRCVAINVSGQALGDSQFLEFVVECLDRSGIAPARLCFEMTENAVVANLDYARRFVGVLHGMGCRFALDDFGSGVASFSNLRNLPMDYLKIDGSFTRNLGRDPVNQAMVAAMIKLARTLNFKVIAEQIEDAAALEMARRMGVDFVQGYIIARPQRLLPLAA